MRKAPAIERDRANSPGDPAGTPAVLSVSPAEEDHRSLKTILGGSEWTVFEARDLPSALALLPHREIAVVVCEQFLQPGAWIDVLERLNALPAPPSLIVTSRCADERLWAEALNLGAWDVLAKPFRRSETLRVVRSGCERWRSAAESAARPKRVMTAAGG